ncbi:MAG: Ig-like domain-containing protein [Bacteroidetes bacterium]|nr:Ig-like domain-containing protein [Bacteroidota bacterium]
MKRRLSVILTLLLLAGCAGQRVPEGGPVDSVPPEIVSVFPSPGTINFTGNSILIEFSEYVDRRSAEEAVFISPGIRERETDWSGREMEITFNEPLRQNTTYVVTIGTDVRDIRASNRMARSFTISFSTGPVIDKGAIMGSVTDPKPDGVMIFSYRLDGVTADTLRPQVTPPDYLTQTGSNGEFGLTNIAPGTYRLFAVRDEYRNLLYDPETDAAGTTADVIVSAIDSVRSGMRFIIAKEDTTPPRISLAQAVDRQHLSVQFSEPLDSASVALGSFRITDTLFRRQLPVRQFFLRAEDYKSYTLVTDTQQVDERYVVSVTGPKDAAGLPMHAVANALQFTGVSLPDTLPPAFLAASVTDPKVKNFPGEPVILYFSDALQGTPADSLVRLVRVKDSAVVPTAVTVRTASTLLVRPVSPLRAAEQYALSLRMKFVRDLSGNRAADTVVTVRWQTEDPENYGSMEGTFTGYDGKGVIEAENVTVKSQPVVRTRTAAGGKFSFTLLPEGKYAVKAFHDANGNLRHDAGTVYPYARGERFIFYSDTVRVRARWPVDGIIFAAP